MPPTVGLRVAPRASLRLTPQMKLGLELLSLPILDLARRVEEEVLANPVLALDDRPARPGPGAAAGCGAGEAVGRDTGAAAGEATREGARGAARDGAGGTIDGAVGHAADLGDGDGEAGSGAGVGSGTGAVSPRDAGEPGARLPRDGRDGRAGAGEERSPGPARDPVARTAQPVSLGAHLARQLAVLHLTAEVRRAASYLVGCLDEGGRLLCAVEEAAADLGLPSEVAEEGLRALQQLDPPGVGARDLRECLRLQLRARGREGSTAWRLVGRLEDLRRHAPASVARRLGVSPAELAAALAEIRRLSPRPGRLVGGDPVRYILPDVRVERVEGEWLVLAEDGPLPRLRLGSSCRGLLGAGGDAEARAFVAQRYRSARRLVRALDRRRHTLVRVMECVVREQGAFFERGTASLRPMTMKTVAGRLGLHESTVARVVRGKHVQTPRGLFPLRHFFSGGPGRSPVPAVSARAARERIRRWIGAEDSDRPLTDAALAARFAQEGVEIARRTVAKYRVSMGIGPARLRRYRPGGRPDRSGGAVVQTAWVRRRMRWRSPRPAGATSSPPRSRNWRRSALPS